MTTRGCVIGLLLAVMSQTHPGEACADHWQFDPQPDVVTKAGGRVLGKLLVHEENEKRLARLGNQAAVAFPIQGRFNPKQGTISFWLRTSWSGNDRAAHSFFHLGDSKSHVTVFKTDTGSMRFVYKSSPTQYSACDIDVGDWQSEGAHKVEAGWRENYAGNLILQLTVDGQSVIHGGAVALDELPKELFLGRRGAKAQPAEAWIADFRLDDSAPELPYTAAVKSPVVANVDCSDKSPFRKVHDFTTIWNSKKNPLPFKAGDPEYQRFVDAGFGMVRLVAFSEGWLWGTRVAMEGNRLVTDYTDFDRLLDVFQQANAEPYIRLAYHTPNALIDPKTPKKQRSYALPQDLTLWDELMERIVQHLIVDRKSPVRYWVASLNEGDIPVRRGQAKPETIYQLYERTARLVKGLDPNARVGGPALAWSTDGADKPSEMLVDFLHYCRQHKVPLDFVCFHGYQKAHPRDYEQLIETVRTAVESELPGQADDMEYFLDEWNLWNRDRLQDNEYGAAYLAAALHYQRRAKLTKSSIVSFNHFLPTEYPAKELVTRTGPFKRDAFSPVCFEVAPWKCGNSTKPGIRLHPPNGQRSYSYARFEMSVPDDEDPQFTCMTGIAGDFPQCDGCGFQLVVIDGQSETVLLDEIQRTRPWQPRRISLSEFAGRRIALELRVNSGPDGKASGDWAIWAQPQLIVRETNSKSDKVIDLLQEVNEAKAGARRKAWKFEYNDKTIAEFTGLPLIKGPVVTTPYFVWLMHSRLGSEEARVDLAGSDGVLDDDSSGLTATTDNDRISMLMWHFDLLRNEPREWTVRVKGLPASFRNAKSLQLVTYQIDRNHNNPYTEYVVNRRDSNDGEYNLKTGRLAPLSTRTVAVTHGEVVVEHTLPNMGVALLELRLK